MELSAFQLELILKNVAELGAVSALINAGKLKPYLKKSEAFRLFGRKLVERWITDGKVTIRKDGNFSAAWRLDRVELEVLYRSLILFQLLNQ